MGLRFLLAAFLFCTSFHAMAQVPSPQVQKHNRILFKGGFAHIGNGSVIASSCIGVEKGKIVLVKNALTYQITKAEWDTIIDINGRHIYPGFIATNLTLGLTEIDAVRATVDSKEVGEFNAHVRALTAFNTDSKLIYTVRTNGVLYTQATPRGGIVSGSSSIMALDGWNWEDAVLKMDDGIHLNWPEKYKRTGWWAEPGTSNVNEKYIESKQKIEDFYQAASAYLNEKDPAEIDLRYEAMRNLIYGKARLYFHADFASEINDIIDFGRKFKINNPVIIGGYDAHLLADRLKENGFSVMLGRAHDLPEFEEDMTYSYYQKASVLAMTGIPFCLQGAGDMEAMNARNLPFLAGTAWAYGLTEEEAVGAISLNAAKIMGVDDRIGSLEVGKDASLFVSEGNALDMRSNRVVIGMVEGRFIDLNNHQKQLAKKYTDKYQIQLTE
ncbi:amidohydrolase family protein [Crocinitomix catalasitica]|uniref:amidohydrolase family protein n=1 Tax=Crocinitomix catalasitica TaxID=184607 RepID=UPI000482843E|nr:amidohydrolase family protein [Crocinitomix catalasitica]